MIDPEGRRLLERAAEWIEDDTPSAELAREIRVYLKTSPVCSVCNDTHAVEHKTIGTAPCPVCPVPCDACRATPESILSAYCANTPCACACHSKGL